MNISKYNPIYKGLYYSINKDNSKEDTELVLINNDKKVTVKGEMVFVLEKIIPLLNGENNYTQIASMVNVSEDYVENTIKLLFEKNLIIFKDMSIKAVKSEIADLEKHFSIYYNRREDIFNELNRVSSKNIYIIGDKKISLSLKRTLQTIFNITIVTKFEEINPTECDLLLICEFYENSSNFIEINEKCRLNKIKFLKIILENNVLKIGPIFEASHLCYECYLSRIYSNNPDLKYFTNGTAVVKENFREYYLPGTIEVATGMVKIQLIKYFSQVLISDIVTNEYVIILKDFTSYISPVYSLPNCKICNDEVFEIIEEGV